MEIQCVLEATELDLSWKVYVQADLSSALNHNTASGWEINYCQLLYSGRSFEGLSEDTVIYKFAKLASFWPVSNDWNKNGLKY